MRRLLVFVSATILLLLTTGNAEAADALHVVDLGASTAGAFYGLNDRGDIAGSSFPPGSEQRAVIWHDGAQRELTGGIESRATGVDELGNIYGYITQNAPGTGELERYPARWNADTFIPTVNFSYPGGEGGGFHSVSPDGHALGSWYSPGGSVYSFIQGPGLNDTNITGLRGVAINSLGHVAGSHQFYDGAAIQPTDVTTSFGAYAAGGAGAINGHDDIVGTHPAGSSTEPVVRHVSGSEDVLATLPGLTADKMAPEAINDAGTVVGTAGDYGAGFTAVMWKDGKVVKLDDLLPASSPWHLVDAYAITDGGAILGRGKYAGIEHSFEIPGVGESVLAGQVKDDKGAGIPGISVALNGTTDAGAAIAQTLTTDATGGYRASVAPGTYTLEATGDPKDEVGGAWKAGACANGTGPCLLAHLPAGGHGGTDFTYVPCGAANDLPADKKPTGCPVIFLPGILGSKITCQGHILWLQLPPADFADMQLLADGRTNAGKPGSCNADAGVQPGFDGILQSALGNDAYGGAVKFLQDAAGSHAYGYPYDWRKGVDLAAAGLGDLIKATQNETGAQKVVLLAHSMGGLVARYYIDDQERAKNVARLLTVGTPYWGAPQSSFALLDGDTGTPTGSSLDLITNGHDLSVAAGHFQGLFWLWPSDNFGSWLSIDGKPQDTAGLGKLIAAAGGAPALLSNALAGHRQIDGFKANGVDYEAVFGAGVPTLTHVGLEHAPNSDYFWADADFGNGDGTVPLRSETQGFSDGGEPPITTRYICGIAHADETEDDVTQHQIKDFLLTGKTVVGNVTPCAARGETYVIWGQTGIHTTAVKSARRASLSLDDARRQGLVTATTMGDSTLVVVDPAHPVQLTVTTKSGYVIERTFDGKSMSKAKGYDVGSGTVTLDEQGRASKKGKVLKPRAVDKSAPTTTAHVRRSGTRRIVTLGARDTGSGVAKTWVRIGKAKAKRYTKALTLTAQQLGKATFASVDRAGNVERWRKP